MRTLCRVTLFAATLGLAATGAALSQTAVTPSALPVRGVSLFTSGVSYIERGGEVSGDATVPLTFRTAQINDILKSLVLLDAHGQVQPVTYGARDPISRTLQSFAVDVTQPMSRGELLNRLRGSSVSVTTAGGQTLTGQIVGVEDRTIGTGDKAYTVQSLTLLTASGLQSVFLDDARAIRLLDPRTDREFREALTTLAAGADDQRRTVTLRFVGTGRRQVTVGYVTEAPLWKISYRLLLNGENPYLQGWALVENTTDDDWQNVHLSLVSGRPVSFIEDLYQPLYLPRPVVAPDVIASPEPQTHDANLFTDVNGTVAPAPMAAAPAPVPQAQAASGNGTRALARHTALLPAGVDKIYAREGDNNLIVGGFAGKNDTVPFSQPFRDSVTAQAQGADAGEQYEYNITTPVTLPRQQAAMIPVVAQDIGGDKVLLYNADSDPKFALDAVRLRNTTDLHLKGGPVTLFDGGVYAGDARMEDVPPGATRLISYAVDLSVIGSRRETGPHGEMSLSIRRGVLVITTRERQQTDYTFKSQAKETKTVLVEQQHDPQHTLVTPAKADEDTGGLYRFALSVAPGQTQKLRVVIGRTVSTTLALLDSDLDTLGGWASSKDLSDATRTALQGVVQRRRRIDELNGQAQQADGEIAAMGNEQARIRKNMGALDHASALYKRYVGELDAQETRIQALQAQSQKLKSQAAEAALSLRAYLDTLTLNP